MADSYLLQPWLRSQSGSQETKLHAEAERSLPGCHQRPEALSFHAVRKDTWEQKTICCSPEVHHEHSAADCQNQPYAPEVAYRHSPDLQNGQATVLSHHRRKELLSAAENSCGLAAPFAQLQKAEHLRC